ncbi:methyltransferase type 11 [Elizabethkingia meningoseptica]|uniref:class I SAM-dependent methyltransferase n=4 Tax=Elizabethkingia meningoseptica TaxID=238 RepID=UPI00035F8981|nr:class I SAM-dependent methyltransferase [Elizabethkingia meningoseptica]AQX05956.1 methyltransferase type 11 [Elizabethkingia meningoseptica]AQX48002.1 methyltransferase type 11 [Elizabethkingia meningoseptica]KUY23190.1 methyltransferase type 11 [Elizabethkingia meningoseptica]MCL1675001.1 class I SAM-dependent methyltransferase [Elizabethkingia meningoseptica]MCL1685631.1 class I SAM-dependent methyltransferase [Elizabethkingia meningoseptica]
MDSYKETFDTWNNVASIYQDKFMDMDLYNDSYDYFCNSVTKSKSKLLEIGCGPGNIAKYLLSKRPDFDIFGIDIAPKMIELAKLNNPTADFMVMDSRQINKLNTKYDGVISGFCLPYLSQTECNELISASYNLLTENGIIYLSFVEGDSENSGFKVSNHGRVYFYYHNLNDLKVALMNRKFGSIEIFKIKYKRSETETEIHTVLIAKKDAL